MEEDKRLHEAKKEIYHIKQVSIRTFQEHFDHEREQEKDQSVRVVDPTIKFAQKAALYTSIRTWKALRSGKAIFQKNQQKAAIDALQKNQHTKGQAERQEKAVQSEIHIKQLESKSQQTHIAQSMKKCAFAEKKASSGLSGSTSHVFPAVASASLEDTPKIKIYQTDISLKTKTDSIKIADAEIHARKKENIRITTYLKQKEEKTQKKKTTAAYSTVKRAFIMQKAMKKRRKKRLFKNKTSDKTSTVVKSIGGWLIALLFLIVLIVITLLMCIAGSQAQEEERKRQNASNATASVSENVLFYRDLITQYANENGIGRYIALIEAIMMQESAGIGVNVMQVDFGTVNTVEDSIRMGVGYVRTCLQMARVTSPDDIDQIKVALQGYNYGTGYITWVWNNYDGVYSEENAKEFSENQKAALGWSTYGDPQYVAHVLRYYNTNSGEIQFITDGAQFAWPVPGHTNITSGFGSRWGTTHKGIDISDGNISGVPVVASRAGTVTRADNSCTHNYPKNFSCGCGGGYGNRVEISHGDGTSTLYGHMLTITVSVGQTVQQGQVIGYVGCTGHSTGYHLHFEIKQNGTQVDPMPYL